MASQLLVRVTIILLTVTMKGTTRKVTPVVSFARDSRGKERKAWTDLDNDSDNSTRVRDIEAHVNTESGHELKTRRGSFVEGDQQVVSEDKTFTFFAWNVNGLFSNLGDHEFISFVYTFYFVCFVETFMTAFQSNAFVDYFVFTKPVIKLSKQGRYAGGKVMPPMKKIYFICTST